MRWVSAFAAALIVAGAAVAHSPGPATAPISPGEDDLLDYIGVTQAMHDRWQALDASCDPDAVFALLYLITTAEVGKLVQAAHFEDNPFVVAWDLDFANRYFLAYDDHHAGFAVPPPWYDAFSHAESGTSSVTQDLLLGMNAHVNYDLAYSTAFMRLPQDGRQDDYDRVNDAFANVVGPASHQLGMRYDPALARDANDSSPLDDVILTTLISWRDNAWQNAVLLAQAEGDPVATAVVAAKIESEAAAIAAPLMTSNGQTEADRQAYCQASGHPPLPGDYGGDGYGEGWVDEPAADFQICHKPGTKAQQTMTVNEHAWAGHANHGDEAGACAI